MTASTETGAAADTTTLVDRLSSWKRRYGGGGSAELERLLEQCRAEARHNPTRHHLAQQHLDPGELVRLHETLLFLRAYPHTARVARLCDAALDSTAERVAELADLTPLQEPEVSGIAGASMIAVFSFEVALDLARRHGDIEMAWDAYDQPDLLGPIISRFVPLVREDWPVEAHAPFREWVRAAIPAGRRELDWLLDRIGELPVNERANAYNSLQIPLCWQFGNGTFTRTRLRLDRQSIYCHKKPLLARRDVSLAAALSEPPLPVRRVAGREVKRILDIIMDTSAMRYRELYGFSHPDAAHVYHAQAGRGVEIYFFGVPPEWRLPLRAYHGGMFFKNGVPAGYVEVLSFAERAEVGFNLYYTFREGESAWLYAQLLKLFHQTLGVNTISVDPYQIGHDNDEAIESGAFWFYRKLGFRPVKLDAARVLAAEERRMAADPQHRSSRSTLKKLANGCMLFEGPGSTPGAWDRFEVRKIGFAAQRETARNHGGDPERMVRSARKRLKRILGIETCDGLTAALGLIPDLDAWTGEEKSAVAAIVEAKSGPREDRYLRLMQKHRRLRESLLALGSVTDALH